MLAFNGLNSGSPIRYVGTNASIRGFLDAHPSLKGEVSNRVSGGKLAVVFNHPTSEEQVAFLASPESLQAL